MELRGNLGTTRSATLRHAGGGIERLLVTGQISGVGNIGIAAGSQVRFQGANTSTGTTTVSGELKLDSANGPALTGNLTIAAGGTAQLMRHDQIADSATVTVQGGGVFLGDGKNDKFKRLNLNGGRVDGKGPGKDSVFNVESFFATSSSATQSAEVVDVFVNLTIPGIDVADGPAFNDLIVRGLLFGDSFTDRGETVLGLFGDGTTLVVAPHADQYIVDGGLLRINDFDEGPGFELLSTTKVEVRTGASFAGDGAIGTLSVLPGGRVRPGPLSSTGTLTLHGNLFLELDAILEVTLNGASFDQIVVKGRVVVDDALLEPTLGPNVAVDQLYTIIVNEGTDEIEEAFDVPPESFPFQAIPGTDFELFFNYQTGADFNDLTLKVLAATPGRSAFASAPPAKGDGAGKERNFQSEPSRFGAALARFGQESGGSLKSVTASQVLLPRPKDRHAESAVALSVLQRTGRRGLATDVEKGGRKGISPSTVGVASADQLFALSRVQRANADRLFAWDD